MESLSYVKSINFGYSYSSLLKKMIKEADYNTYLHSQRLKMTALLLGEELELEKDKLEDLMLLAELHDLGKIVISNDILFNDVPLNENEWQQIKEHPVTGFQIAYISLDMVDVAEGILTHHEWWDGSGYPLALKGEDIPLAARIIALVDAYDVMKYGRNYKKAMSDQEIIEELRISSGIQFDPLLVKIFIDRLTNVSYN
ncbi:HD domain-containing protein [Halanaerobium saccharolyticum]|jgi:HD-GYP domain-containing protein (c-di-GMP phosphodiesterase class II)|uniref:HD domain-containing protein n=1 Tax=Halanaerobium saccharolyticum TaxID=43595 RepID=A0A2T5RFF4_9FIRM|nr:MULTISPECIES: HD domain-containing phosphohydrolase [Halanaerobium]PTV93068.1 HD domain-containing protein [Halanaerobium saccharolyticum]PUU93870.1 MAG: diguanylate cyclase (GGDEF) domain-containing protein [Halanaerobium sp.]PUU94253.1 MAG: diguanylate cyclase (GGDEF) domain-containing protein [Halanaerobium sp.]TDP89010.1 HD domain-containing protein [Halanaerobium saccharolyticum]